MPRLIDADALLEYVFRPYSNEESYNNIDIKRIVESMPTVDAESVRHGRWITVSDGYGNGVATARICECSLCKDTIWVYKDGKREWHYCPNCGATMDEVREDG